MNIAKWLRFESLEKTTKRFSLSVICSFVCFIIAALAIFRVIDDDFEVFGRLFLSFGLGFIFLTSAQLILERSKINKDIFLASSVAVTVILSFFVVWRNDDFALNLFTTFGALILFIGVAPYVLKSPDDLSFWSFNKKIWFGVLVSYVASLILWGGSSAALASIDYLFGVDVSEKLYAVIGAFCLTVLGPIYALSFIPDEFVERDKECSMPVQLNFVTNWILAPLVAVYLIILYAYYIKIGATWSVPKGELAYITSGFAIVGIITYLVSWPGRYTSGGILSLVSRYIFPALIIPTIMLMVAILIRVDQYGITEKRYIVLACGLWFGFLAVGFTLQKLQLKHIVLSFSILLFLSSWGPWGMKSISLHSQKDRLESLLLEYDLIRDGAIQEVENEKDIPFEVRKNISSIVRYLSSYRRSKEERETSLYGYKSQKEFHEALGFSHVSKYDQNRIVREIKENKFNFTFDRKTTNGLIAVRKHDFYISNLKFWTQGSIQTTRSEGVEIKVKFENNSLVFVSSNGSKISIDLGSAVAEQLLNNPNEERGKKPLIIQKSNSSFKVELSVARLAGEIKDSVPVLSSITASALITLQ